MFSSQCVGKNEALSQLFSSNQESRAINVPLTILFHLASTLGGGRVDFEIENIRVAGARLK